MRTPPSAGPVVRIGVALLLCAACFQAGRSYQELSASASAETKEAAGAEPVAASFVGPVKPEPSPVETSAQAAPGDVPGAGGDIITPLNVRDPSALVMSPGDYHPKCPQTGSPEPEGRLADRFPYKPPQPKKMKEGRLLELLKKDDKKSVYPRRY